MKKCLILFYIYLVANASEFSFEKSDLVSLGLLSCGIDSNNQYVLTGGIESISALSNASVKVYLGDVLIEKLDSKSFSNSRHDILKLVEISQEEILTSELFIDVEISKNTEIVIRDLKVTALKDSILNQNELSNLGLRKISTNASQSFAFVNGVNIFDVNVSNIKDILITNPSVIGVLQNQISNQAIFVNADYGDDMLNGSFEFPKRTLGNAIDNAISDDIIILEESLLPYESASMLLSSGKRIIIRAVGNVRIKKQ